MVGFSGHFLSHSHSFLKLLNAESLKLCRLSREEDIRILDKTVVTSNSIGSNFASLNLLFIEFKGKGKLFIK